MAASIASQLYVILNEAPALLVVQSEQASGLQ